MFILQSLREFVDNPMGKGSNAIPSRHLIREDLNRRFEKMLGEKEKKVSLEIYRDRDSYYFHFKIPSESSLRKNNYDVVLHFFLDENTKDAQQDKNLNRYLVRFFSNSPGFTYTYAYAFNLHGLLIEGLSDKFKPIVLQNPPVTRNPGEIISYEKTTYFACIYLLQNNKYLSKMIINPIAKPLKWNEFQRKIRNTDQIELEIRKENQRVEREKKAQKLEQERKSNSLLKELARREEKKVRGAKARSDIRRITPKSKITPRNSSITKIKPK